MSKRGFAAMAPEKQREISRMGGRRAHQLGTAHEWTPAEAAEAGRKGGLSGGRGRGRSKHTRGPAELAPEQELPS